jgi:hypothetical protein
MTLMIPLLTELPRYLSEQASGLIYCNAIGDQHRIFLHGRVERELAVAGIGASAFVELKVPIDTYAELSLAPNLRNTCPEASRAEREAELARWRSEVKAQGASFVYGEILRLRRPAPKVGFSHVPFYNAPGTDPLVSAVRINRRAM